MTREETQKVLNRFAKYVIQQSRSNLTRMGKNASNDLYDSLGFEIQVNPNSIEVAFVSQDYLDFVDKGVSGTEKRYNTKYKYTNKKPPVDAMVRYAKTKPIKPKSRTTGRFITYQQFGFALSNYLYKQGIKPSYFFSKPFERAFEELPEDIIEAYKLDLENFMEFVFKDNLKPQ